MQASSIFSLQIEVLTNGDVSYSASKVQDNTVAATRLHTALRGRTVDELKTIRSSKHDYQTTEFDIRDYLETLETPKNLLLLFPYHLYFSEQYQHNKSIENLLYALNSDFHFSFEYRYLLAPNYDTFFVTMYYDDFILFEVKNDAACYLESIPTDECPTFVHLIEYQKIEDRLAEEEMERILKEWTR